MFTKISKKILALSFVFQPALFAHAMSSQDIPTSNSSFDFVTQTTTKQQILQQFVDLKNSVTPQNWEDKKVELYYRLVTLKQQYPSLNIDRYFVLIDENATGVPPELLQHPKAYEFRNLVSFTSEGISNIAKTFNRENSPSGKTQAPPIVSNEPIGTLLSKYAFSNPSDKTEKFFIVQAPRELGGLHFTFFTSQWSNDGNLNIGIIDTLGYETEAFGQPRFSNIYAKYIVDAAYNYELQTGRSLNQKIKILITPRKRQVDIVSCPLFVIRDYATYGYAGFYNYLSKALEIRKQAFPFLTYLAASYYPNYASVYAVSEHPLSMYGMQSTSVIQLLIDDGLVQVPFLNNPSQYYLDVQNNFWPSKLLAGKQVNVGAQKDLFDYTIYLLNEIIP